MSWLLVALIPGLLMLATFGLERLESGLNRDTVSAADVAEFLLQAEAVDVDALARDGIDRALDSLQRRIRDREPVEMSSLPTRLYVHHRPNPEFQPTPHANPV